MTNQWESRVNDEPWMPFTLAHLHRFDVEHRESIAMLMAAGPHAFELRDSEGNSVEIRQMTDG